MGVKKQKKLVQKTKKFYVKKLVYKMKKKIGGKNWWKKFDGKNWWKKYPPIYPISDCFKTLAGGIRLARFTTSFSWRPWTLVDIGDACGVVKSIRCESNDPTTESSYKLTRSVFIVIVFRSFLENFRHLEDIPGYFGSGKKYSLPLFFVSTALRYVFTGLIRRVPGGCRMTLAMDTGACCYSLTDQCNYCL